MGRIPTRRGGGHCLDTDLVGMVAMTPNSYELLMALTGIVLVSLITVVWI